MNPNNDPLTWLDVIDEALCHLPAEVFTALVGEAQALIQEVLTGHAEVNELLRPAQLSEEVANEFP